MRELHILNLGAGVQSTTLALLSADGRINKFDAAIFADTGEEPTDPGESVEDHLAWLTKVLPFPVINRTAGRLGDHLMNGTNSRGGRFASIPVFTLNRDGTIGKLRRQCTKEYKVDVVERAIRKDVLGLEKGQRVPRDTVVHQYIGFSMDEAGRYHRAKAIKAERSPRWAVWHFPLIEDLRWTRGDCQEYLGTRVPHRVPRSACTFCPYHSNKEWENIKSRNGDDWKRAVQIDRALRPPGMACNRMADAQFFLHRDCKPIDEIDFSSTTSQGELSFAAECTGMCGH